MPRRKLSVKSKDFVQLELEFEEAIAAALAKPEQADVVWLCESVESVLVGMDQQQRLKFAGEALCEIAEVCQMRARLCWADWQEQHTEDGPVLEGDFLEGLTRESIVLDISAVLKPLKGREKGRSGKMEDEGEPLVQEVTKEVALLMAAEEEAFDVKLLEYNEDVGGWAAVVQEWMMTRKGKSATIGEIVGGTSLAIVQVWLAGLLIEKVFELKRKKAESFYDSDKLLLQMK